MKSLETERLILRQWEPGDADFVLDLYFRWEVQRFIGNHPQVMRKRAEAEERIHTWRNIHQQPMAHPSHAIWAVQLKGPGQPKSPALLKSPAQLSNPIQENATAQTATLAPVVGTLLLKSIPASGGTLPLQPSGDTEIGWHFHPDHWGNGYATEAAGTALAYALDSGLDKVVAVTAPANTASQKVCLRIGMTHCGQTDRYYNSTCELFEAKTPH